jgi:hypothetical protein
MKIRNLLLTIALISGFAGFSQHSKGVITPSSTMKPMGGATKSSTFQMVCLGSLNNPGTDLVWRPILSPVPIRHKSDADELIKRIKAEKLKIKEGNTAIKQTGSENSTSFDITPVVGNNFPGNLNNGMSPLDNSLAISNGGIIVSVANTTIEYLDMNGNAQYYADLLTFIGDPNIEGVCDPVVIYDSGSDRFIFFCQVSPLNSATTKLLIFFSKSNNPMDGWWYYHLTGNPLNNSTAFDYPKLAVSNNELYITGNLYFDSGGYNQSILYQIEKANGFAGGNINWQFWYNISGNPFTLCPLSYGHQGNYGPGVYLVASQSGGGSIIQFYDLTNDMSSSGEELRYYSVNTEAYTLGGDAYQGGTNVKLDVGDCRMLSGFYLDKTAHFVFHSEFTGGYMGVNYNRLNVEGPSNYSSRFGLEGYDYCYPSVVSHATADNDKSVMIGFMKTGQDLYPQIRVVHCDNDMFWSGSALVREGISYVYYTGDPERWGDYSGTTRKHNSARPSVWMAGSIANNQNRWDSWISEIHDNNNIGIGEQHSAASNVKVFPNPVIDLFALEFTLEEPLPVSVSILDVTGKTVKSLYSGMGYRGKNNFSFNKASLKPGKYQLVIRSHSTILKNENIIIAD